MTEKIRGTFCARTVVGLLYCVLNGKGVGKQYMDRDYFVISGNPFAFLSGCDLYREKRRV